MASRAIRMGRAHLESFSRELGITNPP
jgi:hypothetical protein